MITIQANGVRWELVAEFEPFLAPLLAHRGNTIKETPAKLVTCCQIQGQVFFLKCYRHSSVPFRFLKLLFKSSQARQEWQLASQLETRNIPIVRHLALGERWAAGALRESILITEGFDGIPLRLAGKEHLGSAVSFVRRMHEAGVLQEDLHGGNILINTRTGEIRLVDLHGTKVKNHLSEREKLENLAVFRKFLPIPISPEVDKLSQSLRASSKWRRSRRAWRQNREFTSQLFGGLRWQVRIPNWNPVAQSVMEDPDQFLRDKSKLLKNGLSTTIGHGQGLVLKRYNFKRPVNALKDLFRGSRAKNAFRKAYHLELVRIPTARIVASADRNVLGIPTSSYLLMEEIPGAVELKHFQGDPSRLLKPLANLLARLHEEGFSHRDLKTSNILMNSRQQFYLIDLEGLEFVGRISFRRARSDLSRLASSAKQHPLFQTKWTTRFLKRYCKARAIRIKKIAT